MILAYAYTAGLLVWIGVLALDVYNTLRALGCAEEEGK